MSSLLEQISRISVGNTEKSVTINVGDRQRRKGQNINMHTLDQEDLEKYRGYGDYQRAGAGIQTESEASFIRSIRILYIWQTFWDIPASTPPESIQGQPWRAIWKCWRTWVCWEKETLHNISYVVRKRRNYAGFWGGVSDQPDHRIFKTFFPI